VWPIDLGSMYGLAAPLSGRGNGLSVWDATGVDDSSAELDRLHEQLQAADEALKAALLRTAGEWKIVIGPVRLQAVVGTNSILLVYALFNTVCLTAGVVFSFARGTLASLGLALVVGALFSFGAFVAQFWAVTHQRESETVDRAYGGDDEITVNLKRLVKKRAELVDRIERLRHLHQSSTESNSSPSS
jgi:hypothetical protein